VLQGAADALEAARTGAAIAPFFRSFLFEARAKGKRRLAAGI